MPIHCIDITQKSTQNDNLMQFDHAYTIVKNALSN